MIDIHLDSVDSTNTYAKQHVNEFPPHEVTCVTAEEQTAGRGRHLRRWISPPSQNIYATFCFRLPVHTLHLISLAQVAALSVAMVLLKEGLHPKLKWPNDIQINGKKIGGVLCETEFHQTTIDIFLGIGLNVNMDAAQIKSIDQPTTSLLMETEHRWDRDLLLKKLQKQFLTDLQKFKKEGFTPFHSQFENLLAFKGQTIHCFDGKKDWVGICHSVTSDGQLNLYLSNQEIRVILSGDITV